MKSEMPEITNIMYRKESKCLEREGSEDFFFKKTSRTTLIRRTPPSLKNSVLVVLDLERGKKVGVAASKMNYLI